jgi:DNA-binding beta-propeller fold protein YncE
MSGSRESRAGLQLGKATRAQRCALALALALTALLISASGALALSQRGHSLASTIGAGAGSGDGQLAFPNAVAVNEATKNVYVVDRNNNRVEQFGPSGEFISAWGYGVSDGAKEYEVCTKTCGVGVPPKIKEGGEYTLGKGQLYRPYGIAVDNSTDPKDPSAGSVYVIANTTSTSAENSVVWKLGPSGEFKRRLTSKEDTEFEGRVEGVAVDTRGVVWVDWSEEVILHYSNGEPNKKLNEEIEEKAGVTNPFEEEITLPFSHVRPGLGVDSKDNFYIPYEPNGRYEENEETGEGVGGQEPCSREDCLIAKAAGLEEPIRELLPGELFTTALVRENSTGVAIDPTDGDAYVDNVDGVSALDAAGELIQRFGEGQITHGIGVAVDAKANTVYVADAGANRVEVFGPKPAGPPEAHELSVSEVTPTSARLGAQGDPMGNPTTFSFQYGTSSCAAAPQACAEVAVPGTFEGFGDQAIGAKVELLPSTTYFFRVRAENSSKEVVFSEERTVTTPAQTNGAALPDGRAWEMVTPSAKNGTSFEASPKEGGLIQAAANGDSITEIALAPSEGDPEGNRNPEFTQVLSKRVANAQGGKEWTSKDITTPNDSITGVFLNTQEYQFFTPDLSISLANPVGTSLLSPEASERTVYLRTTENCAPVPSTCYLPLVTGKGPGANVPPGTKFDPGFGNRFRFQAATSDLRHVVFTSNIALTATPITAGGLYEWSADKPPSEQLQLVSIVNGTAVNNPVVGDVNQGSNARNAISEDGSRVVFSAEGHLYLRNTDANTTAQVDAPESGFTPSGTEEPRFQIAGSTVGRIFFTDQAKLTKDSTAAGIEKDLYEYNADTGAIVDLTVDDGSVEAGESADVLGMLSGASKDGTTLYFVANGVLSSAANPHGEKATQGNCVRAKAEREFGFSCSLYVEHFNGTSWEAPRFVATLSQEDELDWGQSNNQELNALTAHVSSNGRYIAFMSARELTGYDNRATNPGGGNARAEEVFLYDSTQGTTTCVSCDPSGARPSAVLDTEEAGEGLGLLVDRNQEMAGKWLAGTVPGWSNYSSQTSRYERRDLFDDGRLFFNATAPIVSSDENGKMDVYEYEPAGVGDCANSSGCVSTISSGTSFHESAFLDASESGNDAFFLTGAPLAGQDHDSAFDVYDARVCGSEGCISPNVVTPPQCSGEACKPPAPPAPVAGALAGAPTGSGNVAPPKTGVFDSKTVVKPVVKKPTRAQLLAKALKKCKKLKKKQRAACEKSARKKYGKKKAAKKTAKKKGHK